MKMTKLISLVLALVLAVSATAAVGITAFADEAAVETAAAASEEATEAAETAADNSVAIKAIAAAAIVGVVATAGALGMTAAIRKSADGMARQPEVAGKINSAMMLGLVFIETTIIYALIVAILIVFVL